MAPNRIAEEKRTVRLMIGLYCRHHHGGKDPGSDAILRAADVIPLSDQNS